MLILYPKYCGQRPLLLICHCYGVLIMQQPYLDSHRFASDYAEIYDAITGIIFLGTPHEGEIYEAIRKQTSQVEDGLLQTLAHDNTVIVDTVADFIRMVKQRTAPPEIFCFFERRSTDIGLILGLKDPKVYVVNESSGTLPGYEKTGLALDHFSMDKFSGNEDYHCIAVVDELVKMTDRTKYIMWKRTSIM